MNNFPVPGALASNRGLKLPPKLERTARYISPAKMQLRKEKLNTNFIFYHSNRISEYFNLMFHDTLSCLPHIRQNKQEVDQLLKFFLKFSLACGGLRKSILKS